MTNVQSFHRLVREVTDFIGDHPLNSDLQSRLNLQFPYEGSVYKQFVEQIQQAIKDGWMCQHEHGGIRYGRVIKPDADLNNFSVDVVDMEEVKGPHHSHPKGEIDLIMPLSDGAKFDNHPGGWLVYGPDTAHHPTVTEGRALVLYLLPDGEIEFTRG